MTTALVVSLVAGTVGIDVAASCLSSEGGTYGPGRTGDRSLEWTAAARPDCRRDPIGHRRDWPGAGPSGTHLLSLKLLTLRPRSR